MCVACYALNRREGGNKCCFCPSVCSSVCPSAYIANNSRTQRPSVPKFGRKVPHLRCDSHTSFKVKRSKVRVGGDRGIPCRPNPAATLLIAIGWRRCSNNSNNIHISNFCRFRCAISTLTIILNFYGSFFTLIIVIIYIFLSRHRL